MLGLCFCISYATNKEYEDTIQDKYYEHAISVAKLSASIVDGDKVVQYSTSLAKDADYDLMLNQLNNIKKQTNVYYLYVMWPVSNENGIYVFDTDLTDEQMKIINSTPAVLGEDVAFVDENNVDNFATAKNVLKTGMVSKKIEVTETKQGEKMQVLGSVYAPIKDSSGKTVAFVGVDVNMDNVDNTIKEAVVSLLKIIIILAIVFFIVLLIIVELSIIHPIKILKKYAEEIAEGVFGKQIHVRGHDEISEISIVFNKMSNSIKGHLNEVKIINNAYHKYVPSEIFEILKKTNVIDVKLGDQVKTNLVNLSFNIVNFNDIVKKMDSEEMFGFINNALQPITPIVNENSGVIANFKDSGFIAFQKENYDNMLIAAVSISKKLVSDMEQFTKEYGIQYGMGITYGQVMLGIVGHTERMAAISVSDQTNLSNYLTEIAPKYYSHILITASVVAQIKDFQNKYSYRCIGYIFNTTLNQTEKLYDVFDGDSDEDRRLKSQTKEIFEKGVNSFCTRDYDVARTCFIDVLKIFIKDNAAREYLYLCNKYYQNDNEEIDIYIERY